VGGQWATDQICKAVIERIATPRSPSSAGNRWPEVGGTMLSRMRRTACFRGHYSRTGEHTGELTTEPAEHTESEPERPNRRGQVNPQMTGFRRL